VGKRIAFGIRAVLVRILQRALEHFTEPYKRARIPLEHLPAFGQASTMFGSPGLICTVSETESSKQLYTTAPVSTFQRRMRPFSSDVTTRRPFRDHPIATTGDAGSAASFSCFVRCAGNVDQPLSIQQESIWA